MRLANILVALLLVGPAFGCSRPESQLIGKWAEEGMNDPVNYFFEFFSDKTVIMKGPDYPFSGTWSILSNGRIKADFEMPYGGKMAVLGKLDEKTFIVDLDGETVKFARIPASNLKPLSASYDYEFTVAMGTSEFTSDSDSIFIAKAILENRLKAADVPSQVTVSDNKQLLIKVATNEQKTAERIKHLITTTGLLEFRLVHPKNDELIKNLLENRKVPKGYEIVLLPGSPWGDYWMRKGSPLTEPERASLREFEGQAGFDLLLKKEVFEGRDYFRPYYVSRNAELTSTSLESASVCHQQFGKKAVQISFDDKGRKIFAKVTADHAPGGAKNPDPHGRHFLGIVLDGTLCSAPYIRTSIPGGKVVIEGNFTLEEANNLALILQSGALPCQASILNETKL